MTNIRTAIFLAATAALLGCTAKSLKDVQAPLVVTKLYLSGASHGHRITIMVDKEVVWDRIVPQGIKAPNIHAVSIPRSVKQKCTISIIGGPYKRIREIDWADGEFLIAQFGAEDVDLIQNDKQPYFQ